MDVSGFGEYREFFPSSSFVSLTTSDPREDLFPERGRNEPNHGERGQIYSSAKPALELNLLVYFNVVLDSSACQRGNIPFPISFRQNQSLPTVSVPCAIISTHTHIYIYISERRRTGVEAGWKYRRRNSNRANPISRSPPNVSRSP